MYSFLTKKDQMTPLLSNRLKPSFNEYFDDIMP
jgi:hypothetical protein